MRILCCVERLGFVNYRFEAEMLNIIFTLFEFLWHRCLEFRYAC